MWLFPNKPNPTWQILQTLRNQIQKIILMDERKNLESEREELSQIYSKKKKNNEEVKIAVDELNSRVERYIKIQPIKDRYDKNLDNDYSKIIEHLANNDIGNEAEIVEICNDLDRKIVFKYVQIEIIKIKEEIIKRIYIKLDSVEEQLKTMQSAASKNRAAELNQLCRYWKLLILQNKKEKLDDFKNKWDNIKDITTLKIDELKTIEQDISNLFISLICLQEYKTNYLCKPSFERYIRNVKEYMHNINKDILDKNDVSNGLCYLFNWDNVPGNDSGKLIELLNQKYNIKEIETEKIEKTKDGKIIRVPIGENSLSLIVDNEKNKILLEIDDSITDEFIGKYCNGKLNIYDNSIETELKKCQESKDAIEGIKGAIKNMVLEKLRNENGAYDHTC